MSQRLIFEVNPQINAASIHYLNPARTDSFGHIVYCVFPVELGRPAIVYSGIHQLDIPTIKSAKEIIQAICQKQKIEKQNFDWYDLQTHLQYTSKLPGQFSFDQYNWQEKIWYTVACPYSVYRLFLKFIGEYPSEEFIAQLNPAFYNNDRARLLANQKSIERQLLEVQASREIHSGQYEIYTPEKAFELGYKPTDMVAFSPSYFFKSFPDQCQQNQLIVVDIRHHPHLLAQFMMSRGTYYSAWVKS